MNGVMSHAEARRHLLRSKSLFADYPSTYECDDELAILEERLVRYNGRRNTVTTDANCLGNCVVRAISDQFHGTEERHEEVRRAGVARLVLFRHLYEEHLDPEGGETYVQYVANVSRVDQDVDILFIQAICDAYGVRIVELVSRKNWCIAEFIPSNRRITETIRIASSSRHTDSMYPVED